MNFTWTKGDYDKLVFGQETIVRRIEQMQKTLDLLYADRNLLEQNQGALIDLKTQMELSRQHDTQDRKDIKAEVNQTAEMVAATVESTVGGLKDSLIKKTVLKVKTTPWWEKLVARFKK